MADEETADVREGGRSAVSPTTGPVRETQARLWRAGRTSWASLGVLGLVAAVLWLVSLIPLVVVPFVLALFPATLLRPVQRWLERVGLPPAAASILTVVAGIALIAGLIGSMVALIVAEAPDLIESAAEGLEQIEDFLQDLGAPGLSDLATRLGEGFGAAGEYAEGAKEAAITAFEVVAGFLLMLVVLFFFLKDGRRIIDGILSVVPERFRGRVADMADQGWETLAAYFRGQLLVAFVDAVFIGLGLLILRVPLALPLAVLIFFGGLFPIVGAVTTGTLAVLVALADGELADALIVLALILAVQQLESNVLEPMILGRVIHLHPLVVLLSITAGAVLIGVLGAFLAVPVVAVVARTVEYLRGDGAAAAPG